MKKIIISIIILLVLIIGGWFGYLILQAPQSEDSMMPADRTTKTETPLSKKSPPQKASETEEELRKRGLRSVLVSNANVQITALITFTDGDVKQFVKWTENAFAIFSDKYRNVDDLEISFVDDIIFQDVFKKIGRSTEDQKTAAGITNSEGTLSLFNADKLKIGLSVLNSSGDGAIKSSEDVIVHEIAHVIFERCLCKDRWLKVPDRTEGYVSRYGQYYSSRDGEEDFAETVVGYKNSGGDPTKLSSNRREQEAIRKKFDFLKAHNVVK